MSSLLDLSGKIALVTGSSRGIGKELALELARGGAQVVIHYLKNEKLAEKAVEEIRLNGVDAIKVKSDIRNPEGVECLFKEIESKFECLVSFKLSSFHCFNRQIVQQPSSFGKKSDPVFCF